MCADAGFGEREVGWEAQGHRKAWARESLQPVERGSANSESKKHRFSNFKCQEFSCNGK